jgi:hypothetical protein
MTLDSNTVEAAHDARVLFMRFGLRKNGNNNAAVRSAPIGFNIMVSSKLLHSL